MMIGCLWIVTWIPAHTQPKAFRRNREDLRIPLECRSPRCFRGRSPCAVWSSPPDPRSLPPGTDPPGPGSWRTRMSVWLRCCSLPLLPERKKKGLIKCKKYSELDLLACSSFPPHGSPASHWWLVSILGCCWAWTSLPVALTLAELHTVVYMTESHMT